MMNHDTKIKQKTKEMGTRHNRKLKKYSDNFNLMFEFFLKSYRSGLLTFSGSYIDVKNSCDQPNSKETFRLYEDGFFKNKSTIYTSQPNIVYAVLNGKKSWGLWLQNWTDGIAECNFTKEEILDQFNDIKIPESLLKNFDDILLQKKFIRYRRDFPHLRPSTLDQED